MLTNALRTPIFKFQNTTILKKKNSKILLINMGENQGLVIEHLVNYVETLFFVFGSAYHGGVDGGYVCICGLIVG